MVSRLFFLSALFSIAFAAVGQSQGSDDQLLTPKAHITIKNPKQLSASEADEIYQNIIDELSAMYAISGDPTANSYRYWRRFNTGPYLSATHGNRYVNNYANAKAGDYGFGQLRKRAPVGAIYAKDSFTITKEGKLYGGALFLMEKLAYGVSLKTSDWRYWMILPDGSLLGDTRGENPEAVKFCHTCHKIVAKKDHLYFVPKSHQK